MCTTVRQPLEKREDRRRTDLRDKVPFVGEVLDIAERTFAIPSRLTGEVIGGACQRVYLELLHFRSGKIGEELVLRKEGWYEREGKAEGTYHSWSGEDPALTVRNEDHTGLLVVQDDPAEFLSHERISEMLRASNNMTNAVPLSQILRRPQRSR